MAPFVLDPRLAADCHRIGRLSRCDLLLHRNAALPWWILVPETACRELVALPEAERSEVRREIDAVSRFVLDTPGVEKLNVAAIGNVVAQLHVHVVGRHRGDPCWPAPVWGNLGGEAHYTDAEIAERTAALTRHLPDELPLRLTADPA